MKLAIVGTRKPGVSFQEWEKLILSRINVSDVSLIISGGAKGIDAYAKLFAGR
ncbi:MAG: DNA-protecting protein DprA, partial [Muribaculaceae bacterium]|nr:DNA-protecting protein DprA [Muribaculaceae bacterium]